MKDIHLRPVDPQRDFGQLAAWFSGLEDEPTTEQSLKEEYQAYQSRLVRAAVAETEQGGLLGFNWATRHKAEAGRVTFYLFVKPEQRKQGIGRRLYDDLLHSAGLAQASSLRVSLWDDCPECREFAERRGFAELRHHFMMCLDLDAFDDQPYEAVLIKLKEEGFRFTSMEELGDTEEAQRKLYHLNDAAAATTPGAEGEHPWASFEDFQKSVCQSSWYKPAGQMVVIDTASGEWAAMSAITRVEGNDYAYNLFTGVDERYRGRKLGQAVKVVALRFARSVLKASKVHTHHNTKNQPMIAIDRKLGYVQQRGTYLMEKLLFN